jgi:cation transport ATPase
MRRTRAFYPYPIRYIPHQPQHQPSRIRIENETEIEDNTQEHQTQQTQQNEYQRQFKKQIHKQINKLHRVCLLSFTLTYIVYIFIYYVYIIPKNIVSTNIRMLLLYTIFIDLTRCITLFYKLCRIHLPMMNSFLVLTLCICSYYLNEIIHSYGVPLLIWIAVHCVEFILYSIMNGCVLMYMIMHSHDENIEENEDNSNEIQNETDIENQIQTGTETGNYQYEMI